MNPNLVLFNGNFYTPRTGCPHATAVAIYEGRIVAVGEDAEVRALAGVSTEQVDLAGHFALPGLTDAHIHFYSWVSRQTEVQLMGVASLAEMLERIGEKLRVVPAGGWVIGQGWNETEWEPPIMPSAADLDALSTEHPMLLRRNDGHGAVANSKALAMAGIISTSSSSPPELGGTEGGAGD